MNKFDRRNGFTLVELAIVLVIIGLLVGGILVAQSMIETAKLGSLVRQLSQYDAAVANFKTKYAELPGDSTKFGAAPGDNNRQITDVNGGTTASAFQGEIGKFWSDLSLSGVKNPNGAPYEDNSAVAKLPVIGVDIPKAEGGENAGIFAYYQRSLAPLGNYYGLGAVGGTSTAVQINNGFTPAFAFALDKKIDNGGAQSGNTFMQGDNTVGSLIWSTSDTDCIDSYMQVRFDLKSAACTIRVRMGITGGELY